MPIYEYECRNCEERFEVLQKMNEDNSHLRCPKCQAERPERVLSLFSPGSGKFSSGCSTGPT
jgi:putative FmdB family regulatory protein